MYTGRYASLHILSLNVEQPIWLKSKSPNMILFKYCTTIIAYDIIGLQGEQYLTDGITLPRMNLIHSFNGSVIETKQNEIFFDIPWNYDTIIRRTIWSNIEIPIGKFKEIALSCAIYWYTWLITVPMTLFHAVFAMWLIYTPHQWELSNLFT